MPQETSLSADETLEFTTSAGFTGWLADQGISLAFTTYQSSRLFLVGHERDGKVSVNERLFRRAMGMWSDGQTIWLSTLYQLWRLENVLPPGLPYMDHDRLYVPRLCHVTGGINVHDIGVDAEGTPTFIATQFSCLAAPSATHNFRPLWKPPFISALLPEDRCHLNGLAMRDGRPRYATALAETDTRQGWRRVPRDRGCLMDIDADEVLLRGLAVPHSPRWFDDTLWLLQSGSGILCRVDLTALRCEAVALCPGYLRGFSVVGRYAVVGLSKPRRAGAFDEFDLAHVLDRHKLQPRCGIAVVDLVSGQVVHWLWLEGFVTEIYDVVVLPDVQRPMAVGFLNDQIETVLTIEGIPVPLQGPLRDRSGGRGPQ
jgi:uncharacterized protein (TIGR03032 family)